MGGIHLTSFIVLFDVQKIEKLLCVCVCACVHVHVYACASIVKCMFIMES